MFAGALINTQLQSLEDLVVAIPRQRHKPGADRDPGHVKRFCHSHPSVLGKPRKLDPIGM
jgi:hypothetical protein